MEQKIRANYIFEILGRPKEHIVSSLEELIDNLGKIKGVKVLAKKIHEPHPVDDKDAKELFTTFGEAELEIDELNIVFFLVFNMLPSNVEIISPPELRIRNFDLSMLLAELAVKIHRYDEITKGLMIEKTILEKKLQAIEQKIQQARQAQSAGSGVPLSITTTMSGAGKDIEKKEKKNKKEKTKGKKGI